MITNKNAWTDINSTDYDAHMAHPNVGQTQMLNKITKEQLSLIPIENRKSSWTAILGITNGNGLEHCVSCGIGHIIGIDINRDFLDECKMRFNHLGDMLSLFQMDLTSETEKAAKVLVKCNLIIANLVIEHIHLENFSKLIGLLQTQAQRERIVSCVIQINPDGSLSSKSGKEHAFDSIVTQMEEASESAIGLVMKHHGYSLSHRQAYSLPNGKQLVRMDFK